MTAIHREIQVQTVTIANGQTASSAVSGRNFTVYGLIMPAAFTGTALTFTVCESLAGTYQALYDPTGALSSIPVVAASRSYDLPVELGPWPYFKIVSNAAEGGARTLLVCCKT